MPDSTLLIVAAADHEPYIVFEALDATGYLEPDWLPWAANPVLYPIEEYVADCMLLQNIRITRDDVLTYYRRQGVTHIALLPSAEEQSKFLLFGERKFSLGIVAYFCATLNKYRFMHCERTGDVVATWIDGMQDEWGLSAGIGLQEKGTTYH